ncbi:hypothetical protein SASPL_153368 [Salvia splendens]|uniref:non-specific serine/threonine protein kinase n=1 Tax=Salvia splendens TaxID=180675 RepID=A0A8X8Z1U0_SALSN|nr:hypothetical protein SASPL_153368 [Salvia splendens]
MINLLCPQPLGGCNGVKESVSDWNISPRTSCCQEALIVYAHALALVAKNSSSGTIFLSQDQWTDCTRAPFQLQPNMSIESCGFNNFYYGSGKCSMLKLSDIDPNVTSQCSSFASYDEACGICTKKISTALDTMMESLDVKGNDTERATCLVGLMVSVIAGKKNGASDDFERCLPALAGPDGVAEALLAVVLAMIGLAAIITLIKYVTKNEKQKKRKSPETKGVPDIPGLYKFSKAEIDSAINHGGKKKCLGRGSAGLVYKGVLPSGQLVAIKQIYKSNTSDSFTREIEGLSRDTVLMWEDRVRILRECALALRYLHHHTSGCIVHRDIKLTNILLTHDMQAKLSDFGLARMIGMEESKVFTDVRGTIGYMDPEYMSNAKLTSASDIYSFGIVMLQLLSGQRVIELDLDARDQLTRKAKDVNKQKRPLADFQDLKMKGNIVMVDFKSILQLAVLCVASSSTGRPSVDEVVEELEKALKNTQLQMRQREKSSFEATPSKSPEVIHV